MKVLLTWECLFVKNCVVKWLVNGIAKIYTYVFLKQQWCNTKSNYLVLLVRAKYVKCIHLRAVCKNKQSTENVLKYSHDE